MRRLRAGDIGSIRAWLPSRRSTAPQSGRLVDHAVRPGAVGQRDLLDDVGEPPVALHRHAAGALGVPGRLAVGDVAVGMDDGRTDVGDRLVVHRRAGSDAHGVSRSWILQHCEGWRPAARITRGRGPVFQTPPRRRRSRPGVMAGAAGAENIASTVAPARRGPVPRDPGRTGSADPRTGLRPAKERLGDTGRTLGYRPVNQRAMMSRMAQDASTDTSEQRRSHTSEDMRALVRKVLTVAASVIRILTVIFAAILVVHVVLRGGRGQPRQRRSRSSSAISRTT